MKSAMNKAKMMLLCAAVLLLAGCTKTPEKDVVVQKNTEALVSKAAVEDENRKPGVCKRVGRYRW